MPRPFVLPDLGEGLTEAEIVKVLVHEGDTIAEDAPLLEVETDKAQVEIPSPMSGQVEKIHVSAGQRVRVGMPLVTFSDAAVTAPPSPKAGSAQKMEPLPPSDARAGADVKAQPVSTHAAGTATRTGPVPATPSTRRLARELSIDLNVVHGGGPGGRITDDDVRAAASAPTATRDGRPSTAPRETAGQPVDARQAPASPAEPRPLATPLTQNVTAPPLPKFEQWGPIERQPLSHLRRTIAERMTLSATIIPHVTHFDRADITDLDALIRRNLDPARERGVTLTLTSFLLKSAALALVAHPQFNASLDAATGELILKRYHHLGVAVATERGLIVPVIRDVDRKPLIELARELADLATRVRAGKATLDDLRGGTFTVTNIGALGGTGAIPIINYPEVAILGVARAREEAIVTDGAIVPRLMLPLSLTFDHRVADGADGARFASDIVRRLEHPDQLLLGL
jgi:pyruvate dehydrogenase E2 component (dihydrolipoamide acetyltransferase)